MMQGGGRRAYISIYATWHLEVQNGKLWHITANSFFPKYIELNSSAE